MRRLKTALRSTMTEEHLSDLAVIAIHYGEKLLQMIYAGNLYRLTQEDFLVLLCLINVNYFIVFDVFYNQLIILLKGGFLGVA